MSLLEATIGHIRRNVGKALCVLVVSTPGGNADDQDDDEEITVKCQLQCIRTRMYAFCI